MRIKRYLKPTLKAAVIFFCLVSGVAVFSRPVTLTDTAGNRYHGAVKSETESTITVAVMSGKVKEFAKKDLRRIEYLAAKDERKPSALLDWFRSRKIYGVYAYGYGGLFTLETDKLYKKIESGGFNTPENAPQTNYGFGSTLELGEAVIGVEAASTTKATATSTVAGDKYDTTVRAAYFIFRSGFSVYRTKYFHFFPYLGIGGGGVEFSLTPKKETSFTEGLNGNAGRLVAANSTLITLAAVEVNVRYPLMQWANADTGFIAGLQAGYLLQPTRDQWQGAPSGAAVNLTDSPEAGFNGAFGRLMLGMYMTF